MPIPEHHPLARTYALRDPELAASAAIAFRGTIDIAEIEGLVELLLNRESSGTACAAALRSLEHDTSPIVADAVVKSLANPFPSVRILAANEVQRRELFDTAREELLRLIRTDTFWQVRRAAVWAIAADPSEWRWLILHASDDPHWRVRYAFAQVLERWGVCEASRNDIRIRLGPLGVRPRVDRIHDYLAYHWNGQIPPERPSDEPSAWCPFWDWDPAVLARNIDRLGRAGRKQSLDILTRLVNHPDERVRGLVILSLREDGEPRHWADAIGRLADPREDTTTPIAELVRGFELDRIEAVAKFILRSESPAPAALAWALAQVGVAFPAEEVAGELERLSARGFGFHLSPDEASGERSPRFAAGEGEEATPRGKPQPPHPATKRVRPLPQSKHWGRGENQSQSANHPHVRAASLTSERARELVADPTLETSWFVLGRAAKMCKTPIWKLEPETPWKPPAESRDTPTLISLPAIELVRPVQLGPGGPVVSPLGVSGHYGLPVEGFSRAVDAGVNLFFWEPNYATLTRFVTQLSPADRRQIHLLVGTFEAEPAKIRKDVERALKNLKLERLGIFLIFWTQSWQRVTPDVREVLERMKDEGKFEVFGLSTHVRALAADAIRDGWNPVMVRHSAAHRKAESEVFPVARERGTSIITFNNTCYGRLLDASFRPSDCFRFTLATSGVSACFTAPSNLEQLDENLDALRNPELADDVRERLLKRGEWMYREDTVFRKTIRADV